MSIGMPFNVTVGKKGLHLRMCNVIFNSNGGNIIRGSTHLYKKLAITKNKKAPTAQKAVEDIFPHFSTKDPGHDRPSYYPSHPTP
jgi:hypothetical protein